MAVVILSRLANAVLVLLVSTIVVFTIVSLSGDPLATLRDQNPGISERVLALEAARLGLDQPLPIRYVGWLAGVLRGDFGVALTNRRDIISELWPRFKNTLFLASYAALLAVPIAIGFGILSAIREGRLTDRVANIVALVAISAPEFFVGYLLILNLAVNHDWFPSLATVTPDMPFGERVWAVTLPAVTMTFLVTAHMLRMTRNSVLATMSTPYVEMAFLKGLARSRVVTRHALPNAAAPIISVVALNLAYLVVGVVVVENVFTYPGIGQYMIDAVNKRDVPVIEACGIIFAAVFITLNTLADVLAILLNPRLRHPR
jgi:peptide/nickel transport system permease protein